MLVHWPDKYKPQKMCDEAVDNCLVALKFIPDWFVWSKMLEKLDNLLHANDDELFYNEDFDEVLFIVCILLTWRSKFKNCKSLLKKLSK